MMAGSDPDLALLETYQRRGDPQAFRALVLRYERVLASAARRVLDDRSLADEVVQDTFVALARLRHGIHTSLGSWLYRSAVNRALSVRTSERARHRREQAVTSGRQHSDADGAGPDADSARALSLLDPALLELSPQDRNLVVEHHLRGATQTEIASRLGISRQAVKQQLDRALCRLRRALERQGVHASACAAALALAGELPAQTSASALIRLSRIGLVRIGVQPVLRSRTLGFGWIAGGLAAAALLAVWLIVAKPAAADRPHLVAPPVQPQVWRAQLTSGHVPDRVAGEGIAEVPRAQTWAWEAAGARLLAGSGSRWLPGPVLAEGCLLIDGAATVIAVAMPTGRVELRQARALLTVQGGTTVIESWSGVTTLHRHDGSALEVPPRTALVLDGSTTMFLQDGADLWTLGPGQQPEFHQGEMRAGPDGILLEAEPGRQAQLIGPQVPPLSGWRIDIDCTLQEGRVALLGVDQQFQVMPEPSDHDVGGRLPERISINATLRSDRERGLLREHGTSFNQQTLWSLSEARPMLAHRIDRRVLLRSYRVSYRQAPWPEPPP